MSNLRAALALAAQGFFVFPCHNAPGTPEHKTPCLPLAWRSKSTTVRSTIEAWWRARPDAMPAIDCGKSGLLAIDLDRKPGGPDGVAAWAKLAAGREPSCPVSETPSGGRHLIFRQTAPPLGNGRGGMPKGIDVRGAGGYIIAPGARCLDGTGYRLVGELADAPVLPAWIVDIIKGIAKLEGPAAAAAADTQPRPQPADGDRIREALRHIPAEDRDVWLRVGMALKSELGEAGFGEWRAWAMSSPKWKERDGQKVWRSIRPEGGITIGTLFGIAQDHGWRDAPSSEADAEAEAKGAEIASNLIRRQAEAVSAQAGELTQVETGDLIYAETGEVVAEAKPEQERKTERLPEALTRVPGLVGEIVDWIEATARYPSRPMALAAALLVVGTAIGRDRAGPTDSATHLYGLTLAPTGSGKAHPIEQAGRLMNAAGMADLNGPSDFKSGAGVSNTIARAPLVLCCMDEFGAFLRRVNDHRAGPFVNDITRLFRVIWDKKFSPMVTDEGARQQAQTIQAPAMSVLGASTEDEFYQGLGNADVLSGFLNRFFVLVETQRASERDPAADPLQVPDRLSGQLGHLFTRGGNALDNTKRMAQTIITPRKVPWASADAKAVYDAMSAEIKAICDGDSEMTPYYARTKEMAVRAATIVACGADPANPAVTAEGMIWARDVLMYSARTMAAGVSRYVAETEHQRQTKEVLRIISQAGGVIGHRELGQRLKHKYRPRDLKEALTGLVESETVHLIASAPAKGSKGGRPSHFYSLSPASAHS